jgi:hypothetical protein
MGVGDSCISEVMWLDCEADSLIPKLRMCWNLFSHFIYFHGIGLRHRDNFIFTLVGVLTGVEKHFHLKALDRSQKLCDSGFLELH